MVVNAQEPDVEHKGHAPPIHHGANVVTMQQEGKLALGSPTLSPQQQNLQQQQQQRQSFLVDQRSAEEQHANYGRKKSNGRFNSYKLG